MVNIVAKQEQPKIEQQNEYYRVTNPFDNIHATKKGETGVCIGYQAGRTSSADDCTGLHFEDNTEYWFFPDELTLL